MRFGSGFIDGWRGFFGLIRFMVRPSFGHLVGLVTIETLAAESPTDATASADREDATLQQFLVHLSGGASLASATSIAAVEMSACRFARLGGSRWKGTTRLSANLDNLRAELQLALTDALGRIAGGR
jgi:hypothetical protein